MCARACVARRRRRRKRRPAFSSLRGSFVLLLPLFLSLPLVPSFSRLAARGTKSVSRSQPSSLCHCECESFRVRLRAADYRNQPVPVPVYRPTNYNHRFERRHFLVFELIREDASLLPRGYTGKRIQRKTCHSIARCESNFANRGDTSSTGRSWHAKLCHDDGRVEEGRNVSGPTFLLRETRREKSSRMVEIN